MHQHRSPQNPLPILMVHRRQSLLPHLNHPVEGQVLSLRPIPRISHMILLLIPPWSQLSIPRTSRTRRNIPQQLFPRRNQLQIHQHMSLVNQLQNQRIIPLNGLRSSLQTLQHTSLEDLRPSQRYRQRALPLPSQQTRRPTDMVHQLRSPRKGPQQHLLPILQSHQHTCPVNPHPTPLLAPQKRHRQPQLLLRLTCLEGPLLSQRRLPRATPHSSLH